MHGNLLQEELDKIDLVRERAGLNFNDARELLEEANWDVLEALVIHEQEEKVLTNHWEAKGYEVLDKVKQLINQGNVTRIKIKSKDRVVAELPVTVGVVGAFLAPKLAVIAAATCMFTKCTIEFDKVADNPQINDVVND